MSDNLDLIKKLWPKKYYEVDTDCGNCGLRQVTKIQKGNLASEVIEQGVCANCGCAQLQLL